ncbi:transposase, partial [Spiribacter sp. 221]|uniref:transposase n=1 Tax=Spiribacter onubensis TaxID=3122420 RepID=UPI00349F0913
MVKAPLQWAEDSLRVFTPHLVRNPGSTSHTRIGNARRDHLHKLTSALSKNHAAVVVEDLQVRNMTQSASGTVEQPGR